jgi:hypothetical protein
LSSRFHPDCLAGIRARGVGDIKSGVDAQNLAFNVLKLGAGTGLASIPARKLVDIVLAMMSGRFGDHVEEIIADLDVPRTYTRFSVTVVTIDYCPMVFDSLPENIFPHSVIQSACVVVISNMYYDSSTKLVDVISNTSTPSSSSNLIPSFSPSPFCTFVVVALTGPTSIAASFSDSPNSLDNLKGNL